jgi:RNA polymerase sigma factor (sigma-70 family)
MEWATFNFKVSAADAKDIYQDALIQFWLNIQDGRLTHLTAEPKTYVFSIGKHLLINFIKRKSRSVTFEPSQLINLSYDPFKMSDEHDHNRIMLEEHLCKLVDKERRILEMFYLEDKDMKTIARELGYKNADVAKKRKYEVFNKLVQLAKGSLKSLLLMF